ncbi:queuosine salvage protein isoform X2 [Chrysoperla carnea]|uniref:queuosine salvage protein isoform X2 n=1 Tax=Chrysoperla carnea TaxID=189513 RepID=UPI001D087BC6|nr:queuosine salvage protein isoform X2 [Chrysoperla carnea]
MQIVLILHIVKLISTMLKNDDILKSNFCEESLHPKPNEPWTIDWIFVIDTLNFCFWTPKNELNGKSEWTVNGYVGYFALCAAINRAMEENIDILNPNYYSKITEEQLSYILRPDENCATVPLLKERTNCLHEVGTILMQEFNSTFKTCLEMANGSAMKLLEIIVTNFECFRDESQFNGYQISFYKRAQILVADIWSCFYLNCSEDNFLSKLVNFYDIDQITMFADYRVPQILNYFNVLEYSPELLNTLNEKQILMPGSNLEIEIRGCSIEAIEQLKNWLKTEKPDIVINSILLDQYLWDLRRKINHKLQEVPFHQVISIYY